ncbi:ComEC/Rec2 family competence protein [Pseudobutyrivibrio sp.]|uniref:ComEC/Rec2 family competence protein n=1 Tax=Pseudobutyrivibrio sp. TaxID=2014367 RepID=UPI001D6DCBA6|nr:MBL fold metallo-hydrolase [Pseudobutyrivibrio sp.]MBE5909997.1 MBL fold metallo-hydrolase [Pseudobutyrivibrio sp.]
MVWLKFLYGITKEYWGGLGFPLLFGIALVGILVFEREKIKRYAFLWYTGLILVFIYNPVTLFVCKKLMEESTFDQYYKRFFTLIPILIIVAYGFTLLLNKLSGVKKLAGLLAIMLIIGVLGHSIYSESWYTKAENRNKVPQDVVTICDIFADYEGDTISIMAPQDIAVYLRQMDSRFTMPYSRYLPDEAYELTNLEPDTQVVEDYCAGKSVDFVVVSAVESTLNTYLDNGYTLYGRTPYYAILQVPDTNWVLTEYSDDADLQGLCYTMYNENDGTLIVIDGGHIENSWKLRKAIRDYGGTVDAWIITHYHMDHIDAFNDIYENPEDLTIKDVYVTPLDADTFYSVAQEWDDVESFDKFQKITEGADNIHEVQRDDVLEFSDGLTITFYNAFDDVVVECAEDIPNNDSLVFKMETEHRSILMCADCHSKFMAEYLVETYGDELKADILQCGHHGNNSMPTETGFYELVDPDIAIFDMPDAMLTSPQYTAGALAAYLQELGAKIVWFKTAPNAFAF